MALTTNIKRGDIFWANFDPTIGAEIQKTRPCVIVSNDVANTFSPLVSVVPITSQKLEKIYPHEVSVDGIAGLKNSKVKVHQVRTFDKKRLQKRIGKLPDEHMRLVDEALARHLSLKL